MTGRLFTIGYAGLLGAGGLRERLAGEAIDTIVDVRLHAYSHNRAFSRATRLTIEAAGFRYVHLPDLGNLAYKTGGIAIRNIEAIEEVLDELRAGRSVALFCACPRYQDCHRRELAIEVERRAPGVDVRHLPAAAR
jgi:Protein of unknown function, DUF488